jgi:hypothetical protein
MAIGDTMRRAAPPDYLTRFKTAVWRELIESAVVEWNPGQTVNLSGAGFDGTEIEYLDGDPEEEITSFLVYGIGDVVALARRLGDRAPTPEDLGRDYTLSRQGAGAGLFDRGYGAEGDRLHRLARSQGDIVMIVGGSEDESAAWTVSVTT